VFDAIMMAVELLDIYDDALTLLGVKPRPDVHRDGDWHRVFHCWVLFRDADGEGWVVMQRRGPDKDTFPNLIDVSVGGHYAAGESIRDGVREIHEELGLEVTYEALIPVGRRVSAARYLGLIDREVADVFVYETTLDLDDFRPDPDEVAGLVAFKVRDGLALCGGEIDRLTARAAGSSEAVSVTLTDFLPRQDQYVFRALVVLRQYLDGERYLVI
jgi:isopentenyldiphosphate isomerase